jgi:hypothetical protein
VLAGLPWGSKVGAVVEFQEGRLQQYYSTYPLETEMQWNNKYLSTSLTPTPPYLPGGVRLRRDRLSRRPAYRGGAGALRQPARGLRGIENVWATPTYPPVILLLLLPPQQACVGHFVRAALAARRRHGFEVLIPLPQYQRHGFEVLLVCLVSVCLALVCLASGIGVSGIGVSGIGVSGIWRCPAAGTQPGTITKPPVVRNQVLVHPLLRILSLLLGRCSCTRWCPLLPTLL